MKLKTCLTVLCLAITCHVNAQTSTCGIENLTCPTVVDQNLPAAKDMLTWSQQDRVIGFRNTYRAYEGDVFKASNPQPIAKNLKDLSNISYQYDGHRYSLNEYIKRNDVTGMMVIKDGKIVWQYYGHGNDETTLWTSRSVGKSVVSTLVGVALKEGKITSLDDLVIKYNGDVKGTVWQNVTVRQLFNFILKLHIYLLLKIMMTKFALLKRAENNNVTNKSTLLLVKISYGRLCFFSNQLM